MPLRILYKNLACFPDCQKDAPFPDGKKCRCQSHRFDAQDDKRVILVPSIHIGDDDAPEPFLVACDALRLPVIKISTGKYEALVKGWRNCKAIGCLVDCVIHCHVVPI